MAGLRPGRGRGQRAGPGGVSWTRRGVDRVGGDGPEMKTNIATVRRSGVSKRARQLNRKWRSPNDVLRVKSQEESQIPGGDRVRMEGEVGGALLHLGVVRVASRLVGGEQSLQTAQVTQHLVSNQISYQYSALRGGELDDYRGCDEMVLGVAREGRLSDVGVGDQHPGRQGGRGQVAQGQQQVDQSLLEK